MRKKNLPTNLSLELSVSDMRDWFINEMNDVIGDIHPDAQPSDTDIEKYFESNFSNYRDEIRENAIAFVMDNLTELFSDMVHEYHNEIELKDFEIYEKEKDETRSSEAKTAWAKVRNHLTQAEIEVLKKDIKSRE